RRTARGRRAKVSARRPAPPTARGTPGLRHRTGCWERPAWRVARRRDRWWPCGSSRIEIGLERVDRDLERRIGIRAPQLLAREHHRIKPLRIVTVVGCDRVRIHVAAVAHLD